jgi:hypothetical protein
MARLVGISEIKESNERFDGVVVCFVRFFTGEIEDFNSKFLVRRVDF